MIVQRDPLTGTNHSSLRGDSSNTTPARGPCLFRNPFIWFRKQHLRGSMGLTLDSSGRKSSARRKQLKGRRREFARNSTLRDGPAAARIEQRARKAAGCPPVGSDWPGAGLRNDSGALFAGGMRRRNRGRQPVERNLLHHSWYCVN